MGWGSGNLGGSSGAAKLPAIYAQYPEGSICTCTNGDKTYKAKDTSGFWLFAGLSLGEWTITSTDPTGGNDPASETVEITSEGQNVSVELSYKLWLYKNGDQCVDTTGGWNVKNNGNTGISLDSDRIDVSGYGAGTNTYGYANTINPIDLTNFATIKVNPEWISSRSNNEPQVSVRFGAINAVSSLENQSPNFGAYISDAGADEVDISALTGEYYIAFHVRYYGSTSYTMTGYINEVYLM